MRTVLAAICVLTIAACGGGNNGNGDGGGNGMTTLKPSLDVSHVVGFALSGSGAPARHAWPDAADGGVTSTMSTLYAIDDQGNLVETTLTTYSGGAAGDDLATTGVSSSVTPSAIYDTPKYVLFGFDGNVQIGAMGCGYIILRKSDGALYCLQVPYTGAILPGRARVDSDGADRLFVNANSSGGVLGGLVRVDMSGGAPQATSISDIPGTFTVNVDADTLLNIEPGTARATRIVKLNGGLQNLLADASLMQWLDVGGHDFYYVSYGVSPGFDVHHDTRQTDGSYVDAVIGSLPPSPFSDQWRLALATPQVTYGWSALSMGSAGIVELTGSGFGMAHAVTGLSAIADVRGVGSSMFVQGTDAAGNGGIVRIDVPAFMQTMILQPGAFTLTAISVSKTGELTFAGLRNSDGKHVVGNVPAGTSTYTILDATAPIVTTLTRIN